MSIDIDVLFTIAVMHAFAVASPGPDFAVVMKQSLQQGRRIGIITSIGVGIGILLHVTYSILGVSLIIEATPWIYHSLIYAAALYLIWMGIGGLRSKTNAMHENSKGANSKGAKGAQTEHSPFKAFMVGFITNGLNPKATLFFLTLFTLAIPQDTDLISKVAYGVYLSCATALWFISVSLLVSHTSVRKAYLTHGYIFDRLMGGVLILMAILLVIT